MNPNTSSNISGLAKLGALHRRFLPEYSEEDELISNLAGAAQDEPEQVAPQRVPSVYDKPPVNQMAGLAALQNLLGSPRQQEPIAPEIAPIAPETARLSTIGARSASLPLVPEDDSSPFIMKPSSQYLHAGNLPSLRAAAEAPKPKKLTPEQVKFYDQSPAAQQNMSPETKKLYATTKQNENKAFQEKIANIEKTKELEPVQGAVDEIAKDPMALAQFSEITGVDYTPELQKALRPYEALATQALGTLSEEEALIRKRFNEGNMTQQDKIYLGLAIAIPAIMAGIYGGGQAALASVAGGLSGAAQSMTARDARNVEDRKRLGDIGKEKLTIEASKADLSKKLRESMPEDQVGNLLAGAKTVTIPETGETGIRVGNDALYYNTANLSKGNIKDEVKEMRTLAKDARERMEAINSLYDVTKDLDNVYDQLMKTGTVAFIPAVAGKAFEGGENWLSKDVIDPKTGKKMRASILVGQLVEKGLDKYRTSQIGGSRAITEAMRTHFDALLGNPFKLDQALSIEDAKNMAEAFQTIATKEFIAGMEAEGFLKQPLEQKFLLPIEEKRIALSKSQKARNKEQEAEDLIKNMTPEQARQFRAGNVVEM